MTKLHQGQSQKDSTVEDAELISALQDITSAEDVSDACQAIARYASSLNGELLCMKICDKNDEAQTTPIFSAYHPRKSVPK